MKKKTPARINFKEKFPKRKSSEFQSENIYVNLVLLFFITQCLMKTFFGVCVCACVRVFVCMWIVCGCTCAWHMYTCVFVSI